MATEDQIYGEGRWLFDIGIEGEGARVRHVKMRSDFDATSVLEGQARELGLIGPNEAIYHHVRPVNERTIDISRIA